jgi:hypothetical protein
LKLAEKTITRVDFFIPRVDLIMEERLTAPMEVGLAPTR